MEARNNHRPVSSFEPAQELKLTTRRQVSDIIFRVNKAGPRLASERKHLHVVGVEDAR